MDQWSNKTGMGDGGRRLRRREATRERILRAAVQLAEEEGWSGVTMRKIADRIDYSHAALYAYFATKEDLYLALLREGLALFRAALAAAADDAAPSPDEAVLALASAQWTFAWRHPGLYQVMHGLGGVAFATADTREEGMRAAEPAIAVVGAYLARHGRDPRDAARKTALLWSTVHGLVSLTMAGRFGREEGAALVAEAARDARAAWSAPPPSGDGEIVARGTAMTPISGIDPTAPVISRHEVEIRAPLDVVWRLHADVAAWPTWNPDISAVAIEQPLAPGASFRWQTAGLDIRSTVYALSERARILWGGTVAGITGVHQWTFRETAGGVRVATEESWSGEPVEGDVAAMQEALDRSLASWLHHLKVAAEAAT